MIARLAEALQARLTPPYFAEIARRVWVEVSERKIDPDVEVFRRGRDPAPGAKPEGGIAVADAPRTRPIVISVPHDERRETLVEVRRKEGKELRLVASIEVLSLSNKFPGAKGRELYRRKQRELLGSDVHLIEIDLLRGGRHATAVPRDRLIAEAGPFDYHVSIHHADDIEDYFIYPIRLDERLPEIAIPLLPDDPDVVIDLQAVFDHCYDTGPYRVLVDYAEDAPVPPLRPDQAEWAAGLLARAGAANPPAAP